VELREKIEGMGNLAIAFSGFANAPYHRYYTTDGVHTSGEQQEGNLNDIPK
jgi:hypothetical protein